MKIHSDNIILSIGDFSKSQAFAEIKDELLPAIKSVTWHSDKLFLINPVRRGNGVNPIKANFVKYLVDRGWLSEQYVSLVKTMRPGKLDVIKKTKYGIFAVEWETGNISSSHRALNKMAIGIIQQKIIGGILIIPVRSLAQYLTDRIGNFEEISPYIPMYKELKIDNGFLGIIAIIHDELSIDAPLIPKGKDGNAEKTEKEIQIIGDLLHS